MEGHRGFWGGRQEGEEGSASIDMGAGCWEWGGDKKSQRGKQEGGK